MIDKQASVYNILYADLSLMTNYFQTWLVQYNVTR